MRRLASKHTNSDSGSKKLFQHYSMRNVKYQMVNVVTSSNIRASKCEHHLGMGVGDRPSFSRLLICLSFPTTGSFAKNHEILIWGKDVWRKPCLEKRRGMEKLGGGSCYGQNVAIRSPLFSKPRAQTNYSLIFPSEAKTKTPANT